MNQIVEAVLNALPEAEVAKYAEEVAGLTKREHLDKLLHCDDNDDPEEPYDLIAEAMLDGRLNLEVLVGKVVVGRMTSMAEAKVDQMEEPDKG